ncbi:MAG: hypothetical protein P8Z35_24540 [Ignavibacteriaceae bacterium]
MDVCSSYGIAFVIALAAISFQAIKAAAANPVESEKLVPLTNEEKLAGSYKINWNAAELSRGVYFYRIQAGSYNQVRKMLLIK